MKKLILTAAAFALTTGVAFAERPDADVLEFSKMQVSYRAGHNQAAMQAHAANKSTTEYAPAARGSNQDGSGNGRADHAGGGRD